MSGDIWDLCVEAYQAGIAAGRDAKPGQFFEMPEQYLDDRVKESYLDGWIEAREAVMA